MFYLLKARIKGMIKRFLGKEVLLPCEQIGDCPYEYDKDSDRDIEGMPFVGGDLRSCPIYGHVCPEYMGDFGLSVEELKIRATIHCGNLMKHFVETGQLDTNSEEYKTVMQEYKKIISKYPREEFPKYY